VVSHGMRRRLLLRIGLRCRGKEHWRTRQNDKTKNSLHGISPKNLKSPVEALKHKKAEKSREIMIQEPIDKREGQSGRTGESREGMPGALRGARLALAGARQGSYPPNLRVSSH
jgi:hypothetical protein